jgi:flagellar biogenesis protein FliO
MRAAVLSLIIALLAAPAARGESSANARASVTPAPTGPFEQTMIRRTTDGGGTPATQTSLTAGSPTSPWNMGRVPLALGAVILLIIAMRRLGKGMLPGAANHRASRAVQVLVRSTVAPKQQIMLIQVGRRLVLVGSAGAEMNPLCEIDDADEVAEVLGQIRSERRTAAKSFRALFGRVERAYESQDVPAPDESEGEVDTNHPDAATAETREELSGLTERVRRIANQFQSS